MRVSALTLAKEVRPIEHKDKCLDHVAFTGLQSPTCCVESPRIMLSMVILTREGDFEFFTTVYERWIQKVDAHANLMLAFRKCESNSYDAC